MKSSWFARNRNPSAGLLACALACALAVSSAHAAEAPAPGASAAKEPSAKASSQAEKAAAEQKEDVDKGRPWVRGANFLSLRFGTARSTAKDAPAGGVAGGFGSYHFLDRRWAVGIHADAQLLGKFGGGAELAVPVTVELTRHFRWATETMRPYVGIGAGGFFHKTYRTGGDSAHLRPGMYVSGGLNTPISARSLLGLDVRASMQADARTVDPLFPNEHPNASSLSFQVNYLRRQ